MEKSHPKDDSTFVMRQSEEELRAATCGGSRGSESPWKTVSAEEQSSICQCVYSEQTIFQAASQGE